MVDTGMTGTGASRVAAGAFVPVEIVVPSSFSVLASTMSDALVGAG